MARFAVRGWPLPTKPDTSWGYGTALVPIPGTDQVLLSLPSGGTRSPWCVVDLGTGSVNRGRGLPGGLRAVVFPAPTEADPRPWALATYGLCRLELDDQPRVADITRNGIGKYQAELFEVGAELLGIGHSRGRSLLLVSKHDGSVRKRIRVAGPRTAYPISGDRLRFIGPHHAQATDIDPTSGAIVARHPLPYGVHASHITGQVFTVAGERQDFIGAPGWDVLPRQLTVLDATTLDITRSAPCPPDAVEILGTDSAGRIVVGALNGLTLHDPGTLAIVDTYQHARIAGAVLHPTRDLVALLNNRDTNIHVVTW